MSAWLFACQLVQPTRLKVSGGQCSCLTSVTSLKPPDRKCYFCCYQSSKHRGLNVFVFVGEDSLLSHWLNWTLTPDKCSLDHSCLELNNLWYFLDVSRGYIWQRTCSLQAGTNRVEQTYHVWLFGDKITATINTAVYRLTDFTHLRELVTLFYCPFYFLFFQKQ